VCETGRRADHLQQTAGEGEDGITVFAEESNWHNRWQADIQEWLKAVTILRFSGKCHRFSLPAEVEIGRRSRIHKNHRLER
jgi:hypothetical protein